MENTSPLTAAEEQERQDLLKERAADDAAHIAALNRGEYAESTMSDAKRERLHILENKQKTHDIMIHTRGGISMAIQPKEPEERDVLGEQRVA